MPDIKLDNPDFNIDDLDGLSAEELETLAEQDTGDTELSPDDQNFSINGIDELNSTEPGEEEIPPTEEPEETTGLKDDDLNKEAKVPAEEPVIETPPAEEKIDFQAKYNETMIRLGEQKLLDDAAASKPTESETPPDTGTAYERALESVSLDTTQQARFDELAEFDEDAANDFKDRIKDKQLLASVFDKQEKQDIQKSNDAADALKSEQQKFTDAINLSANLSSWQKNAETWDDVQGMHKRLLRNPDYVNADIADQMKRLEKRFSSFAGITSDQKPTETEVPPVDNPAAQKKIADIENKVTPPSSLSSVSGGDGDNKPGRIKLDNSSDATDIQILMDRAAESDDPEAIDKLLSSVDFA